ncbi:MAG: 4-hydroxy-3-methylbut-2-enyl diphosphate reductase [Tepidisphaeraceae bacterium]
MKVILANPRGFCAGVNMAIDCVDQVLALRGPPVYVYHEIVHNRHVVSRFQRQGVTFVDDIAQIPEGGVVIYSAHGISPEIRRQARARGLLEVDATCPLVTKVHMEVLRYAKDGYMIIFIGHRNHDEAVGTVGEAPQSVIVVESPEEVEKLTVPDVNRVAFVTQTTLSVSEAARTTAALKAKFPTIRYPHKEDICYATTNRQSAVSDLAAEVDVVLVVGSQNSSNSKRLVETAKEQGKSAYLIDDESELDATWLEDATGVLVTAGASAPDDLVQALLDRLRREFGGQVETRTLVEEDVSFELPKSVRKLLVLN